MTKSKVYIFGGGFMGKQLLDGINSFIKRNGSAPFGVVIIEDRIFSSTDVEAALARARREHGEPFAIINAIGKKGSPNVDWCEDHKEEVFFSNVEVPLLLAEASWRGQIPFIHISTGCIFDGVGPFLPSSVPNFGRSYYSYTKLQAERRLVMMQKNYPGSYLEMHRIRMPFVDYPDGVNLLTKLISYPTLVDAPNSLTYVPDYTEMVAQRLFGLYKDLTLLDWSDHGSFTITINATNPGSVTSSQIIGMIDEISGEKHDKKYITPEELNKIVKTPRTNCVLVSSDNGIQRPVEQALFDAITKYFKKV